MIETKNTSLFFRNVRPNRQEDASLNPAALRDEKPEAALPRS